MCQAYEGERNYVVMTEKEEILKKWDMHQSGDNILTDDEIEKIAIRMMMLREM